MTISPGALRFMLRCIDKLGYPFRGDERLLDVGCGDGRVTRLLRERVAQVVAVDVVASSEWADSQGLTFVVADGERLPFDDGSFDLVHSKDALHHMSQPDLAMREYHRALKAGGAALIVEANRYNPAFYPHMTLALGHQHFTRRRFRELVCAAFPHARFGAFEAHFVPGPSRLVGLQHAVEEILERLPPFRPFLAYNFAIGQRDKSRT